MDDQCASLPNRRSFLASAAATAGIFGLNNFLARPARAAEAKPEMDANLLVIGPRAGHTPEIGTMVSMLTYMQSQVFAFVKGMSQADRDYLFDANANTIGALLVHLAATETYYQMNTFGNMKWDSWSPEIKAKWDAAMNLGDAGRKTTISTFT